jgi:plastocyanin
MKKDFLFLFVGLLFVAAAILVISNSQLTGNQIINVEDQTMRETVVILNSTFLPENLTIEKGTIISWKNTDSSEHNLVITNGVKIEDKNLAQGETFENWFSKSGTYTITLTDNPNVKGLIIVK